MSYELSLFLVIAGLMIIPRALLRFSIPAPLSAFILGLIPMILGYQLIGDDTWNLLAMIGITSLFLLAGIEIDIPALLKEKSRLVMHLCIKLVVWLGSTYVITYVYPSNFWVAGLIALAIITPSTGFIIQTLDRLGLSDSEKFWVTNKAIASEVLALLIMFIALQGSDPYLDSTEIAFHFLALIGLVLVLPVIFGFIGKVIIPHAPGSEFSLLIMLGILAGYTTKMLGVYYLVGAFLVGVIAVLMKRQLPTMSSEKNLEAISLFTTFFIPFYFFIAGTRLPEEALTVDAFLLGFILLSTMIPLRWAIFWIQRRLMHDESAISSIRVTVALTPTLIFTLVIAEILLARGYIGSELYGALIAYAVLNTALPTLFFSIFKLKYPSQEEKPWTLE